MPYSRARRLALRSAEALVGRRMLVRAGRACLDHGRLDFPNSVDVNGETTLQEAVLRTYRRPNAPLAVLDVGANVGQWSRRLLEAAHREGCPVIVHAFEPAAYTYDQLTAGLKQWGDGDGQVILVRAAVSDVEGEATFYSVHEGAGSNSLHADPSWSMRALPVADEVVSTTTVDSYCKAAGVEEVTLLKSDAEGHDLMVLRGAEGMLRAGRVQVLQFEYNTRWITARAFLKDAFDFLGPLGFRIGKLTPRGVEWYSGWDADLETFKEGNYVATQAPDVLPLPGIRWWKRPEVDALRETNR